MHRYPLCCVLSLMLMAVGHSSAQPSVIVSIHPYYDLTRQIAGEHAQVTRMLPPGASPHTFDPTPRDVRRIAQADLVIVNGGYGIDGWLTRLIDATGVEAPVVDIFEALDFRNTRATYYDFEESAYFEDRPVDPYAPINSHFWLDPVLMIDIVDILANALSELDPDNSSVYLGNAAALQDELAELHEELQDMLSQIAGAAFVPFHDAWPYFAERYGLDLVVEIEPFPGREPSPAYVEYALGLIAGAGAQAIFTEPQLSRRPAEVVAESAGLPLYTIDPLGGTSDAESYAEVMVANARVLVEALGR